MIQRTGAKIYSTWIGPFKCLVEVCHPDTAKILLKSSEPKPVFKPGGYKFIKKWLGMQSFVFFVILYANNEIDLSVRILYMFRNSYSF